LLTPEETSKAGFKDSARFVKAVEPRSNHNRHKIAVRQHVLLTIQRHERPVQCTYSTKFTYQISLQQQMARA